MFASKGPLAKFPTASSSYTSVLKASQSLRTSSNLPAPEQNDLARRTIAYYHTLGHHERGTSPPNRALVLLPRCRSFQHYRTTAEFLREYLLYIDKPVLPRQQGEAPWFVRRYGTLLYASSTTYVVDRSGAAGLRKEAFFGQCHNALVWVVAGRDAARRCLDYHPCELHRRMAFSKTTTQR